MPAALGAALAALGASAATVAFVSTGVGAALINAGVGLALSAATRALFGPQAPAITPSDGQLQIRQEVPPRFWSYGTVVIGGAVWWSEVGNFDSLDDDLALGHVVNDGRISSYEELRIDGNVVTVDGSGNITSAPYSGSGMTTARFHTRLGAATETQYSEILSEWSTVARGDGIASSLVILDTASTAEEQFELFPNSQPQVAHLIKASVVYDWRDSGQDQADETTWAWSDNPIVCLAHEMVVKGGIPWAAAIAANLAEWTAAADLCDEAVDLKNGAGTESRYRLSGTVSATEERKAVWRRMLDACDGRMWQRADGSLGIQAGKWRPPAVTLTDEHVVAYEYMPGPDRLGELEGIRATYLSPAHDYVEQEAEPWPTGPTVQSLGEARVGRLDLSMVPSHGQARRLMKRIKLRADAARLTLRTTLAGLQLQDERSVHVTLTDLAIDRDFEVERWEREIGSAECTVELVAVDSSIDDWDPATEQGTAPTVPHDLAASPIGVGELAAVFLYNFSINLAEPYDDNTTVTQANCCRALNVSQATFGFNFGSTASARKKVGKAIVYGSSDAGFCVGSNPTITIKLFGWNGQSATGADPVLLDTISFTDTSNESAGRTLNHYGYTEDDEYDTYFVEIEHDSGVATDDIALAELDLYAWEPA